MRAAGVRTIPGRAVIALCFTVCAAHASPRTDPVVARLATQAIAAHPSSSALVPVPPTKLPEIIPDGDLASFRSALEREISFCRAKKHAGVIRFGSRRMALRDWCVRTGEALLGFAKESKDFAELWSKARSELDWYQSKGSDGAGEVRFTGYYFPVLNASRTPDATYRFPVYRRPNDLVQSRVCASSGAKPCSERRLRWMRRTPEGKLVPYPDRKAIDQDGALKGRGLEITYVDDLFSLFILQVQGAGAVLLTEPDGTKKRVILNYDAQNGREYVAIRRVLAARGVAEEFLSIPGMRKYFAAHSDELVPTLNQNPSYVFFKETEEGPYGATTTVLTAGHSIAIDRRIFPLSGMALFRTERPVAENGELKGWEPFARFAISHDVGGAIRGPGRVDVYWGDDAYAEIAAGHMNQRGELFFAAVPEKPAAGDAKQARVD